MRQIRQQLGFLAVGVIILLIGGGVVYGAQHPQRSANEQIATTAGESTPEALHSQLLVVGSDQSASTYEFDFQAGDSVETALRRLDNEREDFTVELQEFTFGKFIAGVNGVKPDSKTAFWELEINGKPAEVGISDYKLVNGDRLALNYKKL